MGDKLWSLGDNEETEQALRMWAWSRPMSPVFAAPRIHKSMCLPAWRLAFA